MSSFPFLGDLFIGAVIAYIIRARSFSSRVNVIPHRQTKGSADQLPERVPLAQKILSLMCEHRKYNVPQKITPQFEKYNFLN